MAGPGRDRDQRAARDPVVLRPVARAPRVHPHRAGAAADRDGDERIARRRGGDVGAPPRLRASVPGARLPAVGGLRHRARRRRGAGHAARAGRQARLAARRHLGRRSPGPAGHSRSGGTAGDAGLPERLQQRVLRDHEPAAAARRRPALAARRLPARVVLAGDDGYAGLAVVSPGLRRGGRARVHHPRPGDEHRPRQGPRGRQLRRRPDPPGGHRGGAVRVWGVRGRRRGHRHRRGRPGPAGRDRAERTDRI